MIIVSFPCYNFSITREASAKARSNVAGLLFARKPSNGLCVTGEAIQEANNIRPKNAYEGNTVSQGTGKPRPVHASVVRLASLAHSKIPHPTFLQTIDRLQTQCRLSIHEHYQKKMVDPLLLLSSSRTTVFALVVGG